MRDFFVKMKKEIPHLVDPGGCSLHHLHSAVAELGSSADDLYNYFRFANRTWAVMDTSEYRPIRRVETRWLQIADVVARIIEQWKVLLEFFRSFEDESPRALRIKTALLQHPEIQAYYLFLESSLKPVQQLEKLFRNDNTF